MNIWNWYEPWLQSQLKRLGYSLESLPSLAKAILNLSDLYQTKSPTPWDQRDTAAAYLSYFLPLNFIRAQAVFEIFKTQGPPLTPNLGENLTVLDFGSGAGTTELCLAANINRSCRVEFVEISKTAIEIHQSLHQEVLNRFPNFKIKADWKDSPNQSQYDLGIFQTSLNEVDSVPESILKCKNLILIEPATADKSRPLLSLRQSLIDQNYFMWAPCTHQLKCPLLVESKKDWCHDRAPAALPEWFLRLSPHFPIDNAEVTFSYLIASKTPPPESFAKARVVGDPLWEKGKVRQMISRGEKREFLSWLRRKGDPETPSRGDLLDARDWPPPKTGEVRMEAPVKVLWSRESKK